MQGGYERRLIRCKPRLIDVKTKRLLRAEEHVRLILED